MIDALGGMDAPVPQWLQDAQAPKLVVVPVGLLPPGGWVPNVLKIQILRIGQFYIVGGPAEFTIVSGLRVRRTVAEELGVPLENVIFQGYANSYSSYCTTPQEYDSQQYEGGSTMFGRYTLPAYQQGYAALAAAMRDGTEPPRGPAPADLSGFQPSFGPGVDFDEPCREHNSAMRPSSPATAHRVRRLPSSSSPATPRTTLTETGPSTRSSEIPADPGHGSPTTTTGPPNCTGAGSGATVPSFASRGMFRPILRRVRIESNTSVRRRLGVAARFRRSPG